eukprot:9395179-Lingulodinium_polyedra.AAC.1
MQTSRSNDCSPKASLFAMHSYSTTEGLHTTPIQAGSQRSCHILKTPILTKEAETNGERERRIRQA